MAILTKNDLMAKINSHFGDDTSDAVLGLVEDISDTFDSLNGNGSGENWEQKYKENDEMWRKKYRDRFFNGKGDTEDDDNNNPNNNKPKTFEDLFKEG